MSEVKSIKLDYLTEKEIIEFYELFFGSILIKKKNFSYYSNLSKCLSNTSFVHGVIERLNENEKDILKLLSKNIFIPFNFLKEKLNILLCIPSPVINKSISNLIEKKYIFQRDENLVIPDIYFQEKIKHIEYENNEKYIIDEYSSKIITDINNLINFFISKEIKTSNNYTLYKRDLISVKEIFNKYSTLKESEYNIISYFYTISFTNNNEEIIFSRLSEYFKLTDLDKTLYFIKKLFPWIYSILKHFYKLNKPVKIDLESFKKIWTYSFILTEYNYAPYKISFNNALKLLDKMGIIKLLKNEIIIPVYNSKENEKNDEVKLTSSFNFYINANSKRDDYFIPALFSDLVKYNKIVEYEITEFSIKRCVANGLSLKDVFDYFNKFNLKISKNVETTIKQWFDKYGSYFYSSGTVFFCQSKEKAKLINSIIKNKMVKAYEIKKDEAYLIPDEEKKNFFNFLENSGINYYFNQPKEIPDKKEETFLKVSKLFKLEE